MTTQAMQTSGFVRVMADFCASGLWDRHGSMLRGEALGLPTGLVERLRDWCAWYFEGLEEGLDVTSFDQYGLELAWEVKHSLGPDVTVQYVMEQDLAEGMGRDGASVNIAGD